MVSCLDAFEHVLFVYNLSKYWNPNNNKNAVFKTYTVSFCLIADSTKPQYTIS